MNNISVLYKYLKKKNIKISYKELEFEIQSNPYYPELISYTDSLTFLKINYQVCYLSEMHQENNNSNCLLISHNHVNELLFKNIYINDTNDTDLLLNVPFLNSIEKKRINFKKIFTTIFIFSFIVLLFFLKQNISIYRFIYLFLSFTGIYISFNALKAELGVDTTFSDKFCSIAQKFDCKSVINSKRKINGVKLGHTSFFFFLSQSLLLFSSLIIPRSEFYSIYFISLVLSIPAILYSLYFQIFMEKKVCAICTIICIILFIELIFIFLSSEKISYIFEVKYILFVINLFFLSIGMTYFISKNLQKIEEIKNQNLSLYRFYKNSAIFKNALIHSEKYDISRDLGIIIGDENSEKNLVITLISDPLCIFCKEAYKIFNELRYLNPNGIMLQIILYNREGKKEGDNISAKILEYYNKEGGDNVLDLLANNFDFFSKPVKDCKINNLIDEQLQTQMIFGVNSEMKILPKFLINGYTYPNNYSRHHLKYFIPDLIDDADNL